MQGKFWIIGAFALLCATPLTAEGAGGIEFMQPIGQDRWPFPGGASLLPQTGTVFTAGGLGYGVDEEGHVIGGFGLGITSSQLDWQNSPTGQPVRSYSAGYGGTIQGWQHRWGPLVGLFTTRVGLGGADYSSQSGWGAFDLSTHVSGFSVLGTAGAQLGWQVLPWFVIGAEVGIAGTITFAVGHPFVFAYTPTIGVRLLWGAF